MLVLQSVKLKPNTLQTNAVWDVKEILKNK